MKSSAAPKAIRLLVVEDSEDDFILLKRLLGRNTMSVYEIEWAPTFEEGLKAALRREHDVGLFDYYLGPHTGLDLLRELSALQVEMPMILLTGNESNEVDREASAAGAADYLCKTGLTTVLIERTIRYTMRHAAMLAEVRKSEQQMDLFMRSVPCAVCIRDPDGTLLFQNERFRRELKPSVLAHAWDPNKQHDPWPFVDGDRHWLVSSFPMWDRSGRRLDGLAAIDVSARVRAENQLRRATFFLDGILATLPVVVTTVDENGIIQDSIGHGLRELGLADGELKGQPIEKFPASAPHIKRALAGEKVNFIGRVEINGRTHYFESYYRFDDVRNGAIGFSIDVTNRIVAEAERNRQSRLLRDILHNLPILVGRVNASGRIVEVEGAGLSQLNLGPARLVGTEFAALHPHAAEALTQARAGGSASFLLTPAGEDAQIDFTVFPDSETRNETVFFGRDMTERRRLERRLLEITETEQQRFGADLHDGLGQHLTGLACMATALRDRLNRGRIPEAEAADTIAQLMNDAIAQSRALARGLCPVQIEQSGLVAAFEDLAQQVARLHGVTCEFSAEGPAPQCSQEMGIHLYRIAQEAINNAIRHGGATRISLRIRSTPENNLLTIEDNGCGFDTTQPNRGPSTGLRLMNHRSSILGGSFSFWSRPGEGTRVECSFPNERTN